MTFDEPERLAMRRPRAARANPVAALCVAASIAACSPGSTDTAATDASPADQPAAARDVQFFVIVKSSNYQQDAGGGLTLLNYHFFSELFASAPGAILAASLERDGVIEPAAAYVDRGKTFYYEGGHFQSVEQADRAYPNGEYRLSIETARDGVLSGTLALGERGAASDIPAPITIHLEQAGRAAAPMALDASEALAVRWSAYSNGRADPAGIVDDMIFVVVADCRGQRIFHTGLPFSSEGYLRFDAPGVLVPAGALVPGEAYSMFVEFPHVAHSLRAGETPGFASFATATYLDLRTAGADSGNCPAQSPAMDTGQTNRGSQ